MGTPSFATLRFAQQLAKNRVNVDQRLAPIQFLINGRESRVTEPYVSVVGKERDAVRFQSVERILGFVEGALGVRERNRGETSEAPWMIRDQFRGRLVAASRDFSYLVDFSEGESWSREGQKGNGCPRLVHIFQIFRQAPLIRVEAHVVRPLEGIINIRLEVMMNIDAAWIRGGRPGSH